MKLDMQEELDLRNFARDNGLSFEPPGQKESVKPRGLTGKQWSKRKQRGKMAKRSRKVNRKVG